VVLVVVVEAFLAMTRARRVVAVTRCGRAEREKGWSKLLPFSYVFFAISFFLKERKKL
jgi:hypothetical protein